MSYQYEKERPHVFTDEGQRKLLKIWEWVDKLPVSVFTLGDALSIPGVTGDTWNSMACVDRLVELGYIRLIHRGATGQENIYGRVKR